MSSQILALLVAVLVVAVFAVGSPRFRAAVSVWRGLRRDEADDRKSRRAPLNALAAYHLWRSRDSDVALKAQHFVDDRTWTDLDLDAVFGTVDHTRSRPGQQMLFILPLLTITAIVMLGLLLVDRRAWVGVLVICIINILVQLWYRPRVEALIPAVHEIPSLLQTARRLSLLDTKLFPDLRATLAEGERKLRTLRRASGWLRFEPSQESNELLAVAYVYLNMVLLLDINAFVFAINTVRRSRLLLRQMFDAVAYIDVVLSIGRWRSTLPRWCVPEFTTRAKTLDVSGVVHPLVAYAVANDLAISDTSVLITGSNMSGKTTFVRAMGVNTVLSQAMATACARRWNTPLLVPQSSIGRSDSVLDGRSYYLAEVASVRELIQAKRLNQQHLFLIDELFRGTNTAERVAGAYAVLEYLNRGDDIVVVATHDTELLTLLGDSYLPYHFREHIEGTDLSFDFVMRPGPATTRNAIAVLELMQYPAELVQNARDVLR